MIRGEQVKVQLRVFGEVDDFGNEIVTYQEAETLDNVLVGRGTQINRVQDGQLLAYETDISFCFPRDYEKDLRGALIERRGRLYQILGDPAPIIEANLPPGIQWNIKAQAVRYDG